MMKKLPATASVATPASGAKLHAPAAGRNAQALGDLLHDHAPETGHALEIASGTGQHIIHFAQRFPGLIWHPSEVDTERIASISAYAREAGLPNLRTPRHLDVTRADWADAVDGKQLVVLINLLHLIDDAAAQMAAAGALAALVPGGRFVLYGPFKRNGALISDGDARFHHQLSTADPHIGYKNDANVEHWLTCAGATSVTRVEMPANNLAFIAEV
ncbi:DUF938 domain-containing protein [Roseobacter litoralis]|uniref:DUF938 domain-containing protein n=1 Tax=Roseobacter litoralis TaxID=42443 RepID=UPI00248FBBB7|nr:DUF938 domain-containing protein [Roseobacter litoralis]